MLTLRGLLIKAVGSIKLASAAVAVAGQTGRFAADGLHVVAVAANTLEDAAKVNANKALNLVLLNAFILRLHLYVI
jgi:hypothetical protein